MIKSGARRGAVGVAVMALSLLMAAAPSGAEPGFGAATNLAAVVGASIEGLAPFASISCAAATSCAATGSGLSALDVSGGYAQVNAETAGVWGTPTDLTLPLGATTSTEGSSSVTDVACWSTGNCAASGFYWASEDINSTVTIVALPMVAFEADGTWGTASEVDLPANSAGFLTSISCDSAGDCTAAGSYATVVEASETATWSIITVSETAASGTWSVATTVTSPSGALSAELAYSISCVDASDCTMVLEVGFTNDSDVNYVATEADGTWGIPTVLGNDELVLTEITSVSCMAVGSCVAVGVGFNFFSFTSTLFQPVSMVETDGVWGNPDLLNIPLLSPELDGAEFTSVSCYSGTLCEAVGSGYIDPSGDDSLPIAATFNGSSWGSLGYDSATIAAGSARAKSSGYVSVSCTSSTTCGALGVDLAGSASATDLNEYSFVNTITPVKTPTRPGAPFLTKVTSTSKQTTISWSPPYSDGGAPITRFTVTAKSPHEKTRTCISTSLSCHIGIAVKGKVYTVTIIAKNSVGTSTLSKPARFIAK